MIVNPKKDCPHVEKSKLLDLEKFKNIPFGELKCQKCEEKKELLICLICGEVFCPKIIKNHFDDHNKENKDHCLYLHIDDLGVWCSVCINDMQEDENEKGTYIESETTNKYLKVIEEFRKDKKNKENTEKDAKNEEKEKDTENTEKDANNEEKEKDAEKTENKEDEPKIELNLKEQKEICSHIKDVNIINKFDENLETFFISTFKLLLKYKDKVKCAGICLICGNRVDNLEDLDKHYNEEKHKLYINLLENNIICMECKFCYKLELMNDFKQYRVIFQKLKEKELELPKEVKLLTDKEIYEIKYQNLVQDFKNKRFSKILFMVGAGISTSAGIPDFRSNTGLFKQLQDKYNLSSPEEFFLKSTFLKNPIYFYEFTKLFDLSKVNATISHKFMNFFVHKNIVKYVFTQNIDGLEKKAKIPEEKLVYAHGNIYTGHCGKCNRPIDIEKINEGVEKGEVYYCPECKGPCKPNVVFYGEGLPPRFFEKLMDSKDVDIIIIMGTSLKVNPFASIPYLTNPNAYILVFNMEKVGEFGYDYLGENSLFIEGKTDKNIIKFLKDLDLFNEFKEFIKKEYNEKLEDIMDKEVDLMNVNEKEENEQKVEKLAKEVGNLDLNKK